MNAQRLHLFEHNYSQLASAPSRYPLDMFRDSEGNWYKDALLLLWRADHLMIEYDGKEIRFDKKKISVLKHHFVPQPELALQYA